MNKESKKETFAADTSGRSAADWIKGASCFVVWTGSGAFGSDFIFIVQILEPIHLPFLYRGFPERCI